jgi:hypothetical protein
MNYVDLEEVVAESISILGSPGDAEIAKGFAKQFIWRGLTKLGKSEDEIETVKAYPKNLLIKKPLNFRDLDSIALYDSGDNLIPHVFHTGKRIYPQTDGVTYTTEEGEEFCGPVDISLNRHSFVLGTNATVVSYALIRYYAFPLDAQGLPLIREDEVEPLTLYVRYKWSQRKNENQSEIRENRITWEQAADQCKALKKSTNSEQAKTVHRLTNRMLPNFNRSKY